MSIAYWLATIHYALLWSVRVSAADSGTANGTLPAPVIIPPTGYWSVPSATHPARQEGNDGPWSSFQLRVGTPPQYPRVLISTNGYNSWVVLPQPGCNSSTLPCASSRGTLFNPNQSTTWREQGIYALDLEQNLNYSTNAKFGLETVGLGLPDSGGPVLDSQIVGAFQNNVDYYLGIFGLAPFSSNFSTFGNPQPSFMTTLKAKNLIPSISWSYTAGAQYRFKSVFGSAIIGGYDRSRFIPNNLTFGFAPDISRDLVVGLQSITSTEGNGDTASLLPSGILTFVDSTIPYLYLPAEACSAFEKQFGLSWDPVSQLYLVNDSLHQDLLARKPVFTFQLGDLATGGPNVNITLPYDSFDLNVGQPLVANASRYFPLKRATNDTQYALGRAFLQEAYLTADYERSNFSISQCQWQENAGQDIVAIHSIDSTSDPTSGPTMAPPTSLGTGAVVGIVVGAILLLVLAGLVAYAIAKRKWPFKHVRKPRGAGGASGRDTDTMSDKAEMDAHLSERVEMDSPYEGPKEMPGEMAGNTGLKYLPDTPLGELQGSPTPPPIAHELLDPSMYNELPASPVPPDYLAGTKVPSRRPSRQSPLRQEQSPETLSAGVDSLPISPLPSPIPSPPPPPNRTISGTRPAPTDVAAAATGLQFPTPTPTPVPRTPSKPQQRPFQINLPYGSMPASPVASSSAPGRLPVIAVHAPEPDEPPSENSTLQQTPARMKKMWKPADYSGEGYHSDGE